MNKLAVFALCLVFTFTVMISSCSNKLDQPGFPGLRCDLNGSEYIADSSYYTKSLGTKIVAYTGTTQRFKFFLTTADTTGTYTLDSTHNTAYYTDGVTTYRSISGSLNISQYFNDSLKVISGSFNFDARVQGSSGNSVSISSGYFNNIPRH